MTGQRLDLTAKFVPPEPAGLVRARLLDVAAHRVGLVLAPAGHGKTTLLAQIASRFTGAAAWYRIDAADRNPGELSGRIGRVLVKRFGADGDGGVFHSFDQVAAALDALPAAGELLLVLDDFHMIAGSESERGLVRLITMAPPSLRVLLGARRVTGLDVTALRVYGGVQVLDADDLRFRSWEVERLFREVYGQPLLPEDAATLTRRTEGWAAGLAMFHLLTAGRPPAERRRAVGDLSRGSRLVRSYLVREVLEDLPDDLRSFLRRTSALGILTGELCDALLETTGSQDVLEELEQRRLFTTSHDDGRHFAYHQVLLDHLELELTEHLGPAATRAWYARAADLLLTAGEVRASFRASARAEDWAAVEQLLHLRGAEVVATPLGPVESLLPVDLHSQDPWLLLARARRLAAQGALAEAVATFKLARSVAEDAQLAARCLDEARGAALWLPDADPAPRGWAGIVRTATQRNPRQLLPAALALPGAEGRLAAGVVSLLAGDLGPAGALLAQASGHPEAGFGVFALASCATALVELLGGREEVEHVAERDLEALTLDAEVTGWPWLSRIGRALLETTAGPAGGVAVAEPAAERDPWGRALVTFIDGVHRHSGATLREAASRFSHLGAPVPAQWAACLAEATPAHRGHEADAAPVAARWSTQAGQWAKALGLRDALAVIDDWARRGPPDTARTVKTAGPAATADVPARTSDLADLADLADLPGLPGLPGLPDLPVTTGTTDRSGATTASGTVSTGAHQASRARWPAPTPGASTAPPIELRLLGGLDIVLRGVPVDISRVRPRARSTLRLLALKAGDVVHRDALAADLWPDADQEGSLRSLQVAVSSLRSLLASGAPADHAGTAAHSRSSLLVRIGESYGLSLPPGGRSDVRDFEARLADARSARVRGARDAELAELAAALALYRGDLLPEEGAAEWVVGERERLRLAAAAAAEGLARCLGDAGELGEAIEAARTCLRLDPYRDSAWRLLIGLHSRAGNLVAAGAVRREHGQMLAELGLPAEV
ncbi:MAG TPA: BTAD domain-containing putative transcriptional regulator [Kineosporiaceae bacterium]|nr:BTAD domain-containing putative transcriptional regulator [Kineosporiaceae bacterium]